MKNNNSDINSSFNLARLCAEYGQKAIAQIETAKNNILAEFHDVLETRGNLLHLAINEAEALAWETQYPQLVFADLAEEKAQAVAAWSEHQRALNGRVHAAHV